VEAIKIEVVNLFKSFYEKGDQDHIVDQVHTTGLFVPLVRVEDLVILDRPCTKLELWEALNSFARDKSPGPDGWIVEFFLHFFELMGDDLLDLVEYSRLQGSVNKSLNATFLTLISKVNNPRIFGYYRPISLCNLCYKLITKVIANRIKPILSRSLSEEQLGYLKGRQVLDAIGTTHECLHSIKVKKFKAMILKLDLKKAYDCINWDFLRFIILQLGFILCFTNWILG